jgi:hypothetical protein
MNDFDMYGCDLSFYHCPLLSKQIYGWNIVMHPNQGFDEQTWTCNCYIWSWLVISYKRKHDARSKDKLGPFPICMTHQSSISKSSIKLDVLVYFIFRPWGMMRVVQCCILVMFLWGHKVFTELIQCCIFF